MAGLRVGAHKGLDETGAPAVRPCTLPYSLLDAQLGLTDITFRGPGLLYAARQRLPGGPEQDVLVKFVQGAYGEQVNVGTLRRAHMLPARQASVTDALRDGVRGQARPFARMCAGRVHS